MRVAPPGNRCVHTHVTALALDSAPVARRQRKPVVGKPPAVTDPAAAKLFINRELSWLGFNERVLEEARDPTVPLGERLKFVAIVASNLDEFFMVRVAGLKQQLSGNVVETPPDGLTPAEQLAAISTRAHAMMNELYGGWRTDIEPGLAHLGIRRVAAGDLTPEQKAHLSAFFAREVWPVLTPLAVDPGHPFPMLRNRSLNLAVFMHREKDKTGRRETVVAVVQVPSVLPRLTEVPLPPPAAATSDGNGVAAAGTTRFAYMLLEDLITMHAGELFPGYRVLGCSAFRVTRNFDLSIDEDEADDLLKTIQKELRRRERGSAVRLEIAHDTPVEVVVFLRQALRLENDDVYLFDGPLHLADLGPLAGRDELTRIPRRAVLAADRAAAAGVRRHLPRHRPARHPAAAPVRIIRRRGRVHLGGGRRSERAGDQADALPDQRRLADRAVADPRRRERQAGDGGRRAEGALRRGPQHPVGAHAGRRGRARGLRPHRAQDPLQGGAGRAPRRQPHQALRAPVDGQLQPVDGARLRRSVVLHRARRVRRRRGRPVQPADRLLVAAVVEAVRDRAARAAGSDHRAHRARSARWDRAGGSSPR